jgi:hypothetical protein
VQPHLVCQRHKGLKFRLWHRNALYEAPRSRFGLDVAWQLDAFEPWTDASRPDLILEIIDPPPEGFGR